jgi:hypothetical protein
MVRTQFPRLSPSIYTVNTRLDKPILLIPMRCSYLCILSEGENKRAPETDLYITSLAGEYGYSIRKCKVNSYERIDAHTRDSRPEHRELQTQGCRDAEVKTWQVLWPTSNSKASRHVLSESKTVDSCVIVQCTSV